MDNAGKKKRGVYITAMKNGAISWRSLITWKGKRISLGSYKDEESAALAYKEASYILSDSTVSLDDNIETTALPFLKCVTLINYRDMGIYLSNPIYLKNKFFLYYLDESTVLKFDIDDLFYYSSHRIMKRGSHLFVADYGSQINILNRYGIRSYAVAGRDYRFVNGDPTDLRYENIEIINRYHGVRQITERGFARYKAVIHVNGNYLIGVYDTEEEAAIAYNKASDILVKNGFTKNFMQNYLEDVSPSHYAEVYTSVKVSKKLYGVTSPGKGRS